MEWVSALLVGALFAPLGVPFRNYMCWFSWSRTAALTGTLVYLAIGGLGGALLGYVSANLLMKAPDPEHPWLYGVWFGLAGAFILRADFRFAEPRTPGGRAEKAELSNARSLISAALLWIATGLDAWTRHVVERHLANRSKEELLDDARTTSARISALAISTQAKNKMQELLIPHMEDMRSDIEETSLQARKRVEQFIAEYTVAQHQPRT